MNELNRNLNGYLLIVAGITAMCVAHHMGFDKLVATGDGLIAAALYSFQHKAESPKV
jgi:hypothetical protein